MDALRIGVVAAAIRRRQLRECYTREVRRILGAAIVAICIGVPLIEAFDSWDQTLRDGNDSEANIVIAALCIGAALSVAQTVVHRIVQSLSRNTRSYLNPRSVVRAGVLSLALPIPTSSPPLELRI